MLTSEVASSSAPVRWAKAIDHTRCIGCHACTTACKSENLVPLSVPRTYVKYVDVGTFPQTRRAFQVTRCNQCEDPPCVAACPTAAMYRRADGIVDFDKSACIGCKACIAACPYDAIFINPWYNGQWRSVRSVSNPQAPASAVPSEGTSASWTWGNSSVPSASLIREAGPVKSPMRPEARPRRRNGCACRVARLGSRAPIRAFPP